MADASNILLDFAQAFRPPPKMTVSEHAEATIVLPSGETAFSGKLKLSRSPYLPFIVNQFTNNEVDRIICCFGTQLGKTLLQMIILNYIVDIKPGETLMSYPSGKLAGNISKSRWRPLFEGPEAIPSLAAHVTGKRDDISQMSYILDRMKIHFSWDSIKSVSMWPKKYIFKDETKDLDPEVNEACDDRVKNSIDSKIIECSSPLHLEDNIWKSLGLKRDHDLEDVYKSKDDKPGNRLPMYRWKAGDFTTVYQFKFPCLKCNHVQPLYPDMIRWKRDCRIRDLNEHSYYLCEKCEHQMYEHDRREMIMNSTWITDNAGSSTIGFHLNSAYSLMSKQCTFGEMVARYLRVHTSPIRLKAYINNYLAYPFIEEEHGKNAVNLEFAFEESDQFNYMRNTLPGPVIMLTGAFDVHKSNLYFTCWGHDVDKNMYLISWDIFEFDIEINPEDGLAFIKEMLDIKYVNNDEHLEMKIVAAGIDSGYKADVVYDWVRSNKRLFALKGQRGEVRVPEDGLNSYIQSSKTIDKKPSGKLIKGGLTLRNVNTGFIKAVFFQNINAGKVFFPKDVDQQLLDQLDSEKLVTRKTKSGWQEFFVTKTRSNSGEDNFKTAKNHYLDTCVYNIATREVILAGKPIKNVSKKYYRSTEKAPTEKQLDTPKQKRTKKRNNKGQGPSFVDRY